MKRLLSTITLCLICCMDCIGGSKKGDGMKVEVGVDMGSIICREELRLSLGRQFSKRWSLEGIHILRFGIWSKEKNQDEEIHSGEFDMMEKSSTATNEDTISGGLKIKYWVNETFNGGYIMAGCRLGDRRGLDGTIGMGYSIRIWKGLRWSVSYEFDLRRSYLTQSPKGNGLGLTLSYTY